MSKHGVFVCLPCFQFTSFNMGELFRRAILTYHVKLTVHNMGSTMIYYSIFFYYRCEKTNSSKDFIPYCKFPLRRVDSRMKHVYRTFALPRIIIKYKIVSIGQLTVQDPSRNGEYPYFVNDCSTIIFTSDETNSILHHRVRMHTLRLFIFPLLNDSKNSTHSFGWRKM